MTADVLKVIAFCADQPIGANEIATGPPCAVQKLDKMPIRNVAQAIPIKHHPATKYGSFFTSATFDAWLVPCRTRNATWRGLGSNNIC